MAWDPNQAQPDNPNTNYGPSNPYGASQNDAPQNPYGGPENPYANSENPNDNPYGDSYGQPGYTPFGSPLPLGEAIRQLPAQWLRVITHPSAMTLAEESSKASWDIIWVQLVISAVISAIFSYLVSLVNSSLMMLPTSGSSSSNPTALLAYHYLTAGASFANIILVPIFFFIGMGIYYGLSKAFGGQGSFMTQSYTFLLFGVPLGIIASVLALIPFAGGFIGFAIGIYEIVLDIFAIMAVHRLSGGKASAVILIPIGVLFLLVCGLVVALVFLIASAAQQIH